VAVKLILNSVLLVAWVGAYLGALYWIGLHRKARSYALVAPGYQYRAERDLGLWVVAFLFGSLLAYVAYLASSALSLLL
jgi:hypothetical protein